MVSCPPAGRGGGGDIEPARRSARDGADRPPAGAGPSAGRRGAGTETPVPQASGTQSHQQRISVKAAMDPGFRTTALPNRDRKRAGAGSDRSSRPPVVRSVLAGALMGLANLVPGVSGGTMILVCGLYGEFVEAVAEVVRFRFTRRHLVFLVLVGGTAGLTIGMLAGWLSGLVISHRSAMYALFIGLTLGGVPTLLKSIGRFDTGVALSVLFGLGGMILLAGGNGGTHPAPDAAATRATVLEAAYLRDLGAGTLGMSAMILPGISGAYMLLILGRYEVILSAIAAVKAFVFSGGAEGDLRAALGVLVPVAIGALAGLVLLSQLLKWLLRTYPRPTLGTLTGIVLGSVVGIWPFDTRPDVSAAATAAALACGGFVVTWRLSRLSA
ncbi:MAG: DUF368 domain-containing protein [Planctomycetota bacterium]|nr:MAG: DUF368 domain-containing protein [Planctomycetota bacterium]